MQRKYTRIHFFQDKVVNTLDFSYLKILLLSFSFLFFFLATFAHSADFFDIPLANKAHGDWEISSHSLSSIDNGAIIEARGEVIVQRGEDLLKADFARYYVSTGWIFIQGNVTVKLGRDELIASEAEINLHDLTGFLRNGIVLMDSKHMYFSGEYVEKHYGDKYSFTNANITTCDPNSPFWRVNAGSAIIELDGTATLASTNLEVAFLATPPVPYATFSLDRSRETGFLMPRPGYSSTLGLYGTIPFFWDINQERDITFAGSYYQFTGTMGSIVYRSHPSLEEKSWLGLDYLFANASFEDRSTKLDNRYWLRGMLDGKIMSTDLHYKLNIDYVSDSTFLSDYSSTYYGFDKTIDETYDFFGRDLAQIYKDRISEGYVYKSFDNSLFTLGFKYSQNPLYGDTLDKEDNTTVQEPVNFNAYLLPINIFPSLQLDAIGRVDYNYRNSGISGAKATLQPRISSPLNLSIFSLLPQISLVQRNYFSTSNDLIDAPLAQPTKTTSIDSSTMFTFDIDSHMQASRVWELSSQNPLIISPENIGQSQVVAVQHLVEPSLSYSFIPSINQDSLPYYDQEDRLVEQSELSFTIRNSVVSKSQRVVAMQNPSNPSEIIDADIVNSFRSLFNLSLTASYNFEEERRTKYLDQYPRKPFRDIEISSQFYPYNMDFSLYSTVSVYGDGITRFDLSTKIPLFALERFITWETAYSYRNTMYDYQNIIQYSTSDHVSLSKEVSLLRNKFEIRPIEQIKLNFDIYRDLNNTSSYEISSRFTYYHECFHLALKHSYKPSEQTVGILVNIPGIF